MFSNPGKKLMTAAKVIFWIGAAASALYCALIVLVSVASFEANGIALPASTTATSAIISAVVTLVLGLFASWVFSLILYGFGKLVENSDHVASSVRPARPPIEAPQLRQTGK